MQLRPMALHLVQRRDFMRPQIACDLDGVVSQLEVEGVAQRMGRVGAHDEGAITGGRAPDSRRGCHGGLADPTLAGEQDDPHRSVAPPKILASSRPRRPGACGAEGCVKGPGASSSRIYNALLVAPPFPCLRPPMTRICCGARGRATPEVYGRGVFLRFPAPTISAMCSWTRVSTCCRIVIVTSVFFSVSVVFCLIALSICTFWRSALSASCAACSSVRRSFCDWRLPASKRTGPVYAAWVEKARLSRMYGYGSMGILPVTWRVLMVTQAATRKVCMIRHRHDPMKEAMPSASCSPNVACS